ncbi:MAG: hypothetical protein HZB09_01860 [Candidatus Yonathbacteria bacterium]|nr:hypothetical protein [Candidatus Yonathbacteria bacterium]
MYERSEFRVLPRRLAAGAYIIALSSEDRTREGPGEHLVSRGGRIGKTVGFPGVR